MYKITIDQLNALANYLGNRPYVEAKPFIEMLSSLDKSEEKPELKEVDMDLSEASNG